MRRSRVRHGVGWLSTNSRCSGEPRCPGPAKIGAEVEWAGKTSRARRTYLSSAAPGAAPFARAVHAHRGIENRPHRLLDVVFRDDLMRPRTDGGPANMAMNRHAALDIIKAIPTKASLKVRRKTVGGDDDLATAISQNGPQASSDCLDDHSTVLRTGRAGAIACRTRSLRLAA